MANKKAKGAAKRNKATTNLNGANTTSNKDSPMNLNGFDFHESLPQFYNYSNDPKRFSRNDQPSGSGSNTPTTAPVNMSDRSATPNVSRDTKDQPQPVSSIPQSDNSEDVAQRAEKVKETGNVAFKAGKYMEAIDLYTEAIQLKPSEPSYLTNRAAAYMGLKRFRPALEDCQHASSLQSSSPSSKTLLRLARCQLALGSTTPASSTINQILSIEPNNTQAIALQEKIKIVETHVKNFEKARGKKEWGLARLALDKCLQAIEGEGGEVPTEWRIWRVELDLTKGNWDSANSAANDALRTNPNSPDVLTLRGLVLFLSGKLPQALQHVQNALRLDPSCEPAQKLRKRVKDVERLKEEGNVAFKAGNLEEAIVKYTETLERIGDSEEEGRGGQIRATLLSNRATTLLKLSRYTEALKDIDISLELSPNSFKALRTRARLHLHLEKFDACVADFKSSIEQAQTESSTTETDIRALRTELKKAEAALKRSKTKDYYKILGVDRECTDADIKKAYRKESLKHHPDKGGDEEKFKLVVEANAVLSDPQRRARYDMGEDEDGMNQGGMPGGGFNHMDLSEIFAQFQGGGGGGFGPFGQGGGSGASFTSFGSGGPGGGFPGGRTRGHQHSHGFPF